MTRVELFYTVYLNGFRIKDSRTYYVYEKYYYPAQNENWLLGTCRQLYKLGFRARFTYIKEHNVYIISYVLEMIV